MRIPTPVVRKQSAMKTWSLPIPRIRPWLLAGFAKVDSIAIVFSNTKSEVSVNL